MNPTKGLTAFWAATVLACVFLHAAWADLPPVAEPFHPPQTEAEKALDHILTLDRTDDGDMLYFILKLPRQASGKEKEYTQLFTANLLAVWEKAQKEAAQKECGGKYVPGEQCGLMDVSPITCQQDNPDHYLYRTVREEKNTALQ